MKDYRQPTWAILTVLLWLACGITLLFSFGASWSWIPISLFTLLTIATTRAFFVLMDREERELPLQAMGVLLALAGIVAIVVFAP